MNKERKYKSGVSLLEVAVASAIVLAIMAGLIALFNASFRAGLETIDRTRAAFLAEEGLEAIISMRDSGWNKINSLNPGAIYGLEWDANGYKATTSPEIIDDQFTRQIVISAVKRDTESDITEDISGTEDPLTRKVTSTVLWGGSESITIETYVADLFSE